MTGGTNPSIDDLLKTKWMFDEQQHITHTGTWEWDFRKREARLSEEACRIFGIDSAVAMLNAASLIWFIHPDDTDTAKEALEQSIAGHMPFNLVFRITRQDGIIRRICSRGQSYDDSHGAPIRLFGTIQDITDNKFTEEYTYQALLEQATKRPIQFEETMLRLAREFINIPPGKPGAAIENALGVVGAYCDADRVTVYLYDWENAAANHLCEWDKKQEYYAGEKCRTIPFHMMMDILACHEKGQVYRYKKERQNPKNPFDETADISGCETGIVFPLFQGGRLFATLGFASLSHIFRYDAHESGIRIFAEMISNVLQRIDNDKILHEIQANNKFLLDSINEGFGMYERDGTVLYVNNALAQRYGKIPEEYIGAKMGDFLPEDKYADLRQNRLNKLKEAFDTGSPVFFEDARDEYWFSHRFYPVFIDGKVKAVSLISTDITAKKQAEEESRRNLELEKEAELLRVKEQEYLQFLDGFAEATWIHDIQKETREYSPQWLKRIGAEHIRPEDMNSFIKSIIHPDDKDRIFKHIKEVYEQNVSKCKLEYRLKTAGNEYIWVLDQGKVLYDMNGAPRKIYGTLMDITERKLSEHTLAFQAMILSTVNEAVIASDGNFLITYWNEMAEKLFGWTSREVIGMIINILLKPEFEGTSREEVIRNTLRDGSFTGEMIYRHKNGAKISAEVRSRAFKNNSGEFTGIVSTFRDITKRRQNETTIRRQNTILKAINSIYENSISCKTVKQLGIKCLEIVESMTKSQISFIAELDKDGLRRDIAISDTGWEICAMHDKTGHRKFSVLKVRGLYGVIYETGKTLLTNEAIGHPDSAGVPEGHPPVSSFLGVPFIQGGEVKGMVAAANREGGYTEEEKEILESLTPTIFEVLLRKRAEVAVQESETLMRTIMDSASDFIFIKDRQHKVVMVNKAYGDVFDVDIQSVIGKDDYELYPDPVMAEEVIGNDRVVMETGTKHIFQESAVTPYGRKTFSLSKVPWRDAKDKIIGIVGIAHDITELMQHEAELKAIKDDLALEVETLKTLHTLNSNFIMQDNLETIYKGILKAAVSMTNTEKGSIQLFDEDGQKLKMIQGCGLKDSFMQNFHTVGLDVGTCGKAYKEKRRIIVEDVNESPLFLGKPSLPFFWGEGIQCEQSTPLISSSGKFVGVLNTYHPDKKQFKERELRMLDLLARLAADTIERARTEMVLEKAKQQALDLVKELQEADRNKNEFLNTLSHELRNPLAAIVAGLSLLNVSNDKQQTGNTKKIIERQIDQLCHLVNDLLDLTRINSNKISLKKEAMDLNKLAISVAEDHKVLFEKRNVRLDIKINSEDSLPIQADPVRLNQIIGNLLHNSLKFTEAGGKTQLIVCQEENDGKKEAVICVIDDGIGIKPEFLPSVFEPFTQADGSLDRPNSGLGLGLSIVKGIAELHGGSVSVQSEGLGCGSRFCIRLPAADNPPKAEVRTEKATQAARPLNILVIEDNRDLADILCTMFTIMGHKTVSACNGIEGIRKAKESRPDIIFCDIGLPEMNGFEVARTIRKDETLSGVFMVALTGYAGSRDAEQAILAGFNRHLSKPVNITVLKAVLSEVL